MQVTIIPIVIGAFGTVTKGLLKGLEDLEVGKWVETIQTTALLRTARILRRLEETYCYSDSSEKPSANADVKSSNEWIIIIWKNVKRRTSTSTLLGNWKKLWNMKVTVIPIVIGAFGTVTKGLLKGLDDLEVRERMETIQTTVLFRSARIMGRVLETWGDLL